MLPLRDDMALSGAHRPLRLASQFALWRRFLGLALTAGVLASCKKPQEAPECLENRDRARAAALQGNLQRASESLAEARRVCSARSEYDLQRLEKVIAERRDLENAKEQQEQQRRTEAEKLPLRQFVSWVRGRRNAVSANLADVKCAERGSPEFGFCEAERPGSPEMQVRYWASQETAFRYSFTSNLPLSCQDLGTHRRVRTWQRGQTSYELCELSEHELRSLSVLLAQGPDENRMFVFSHAYVQRDRAFARLLEGRS